MPDIFKRQSIVECEQQFSSGTKARGASASERTDGPEAATIDIAEDDLTPTALENAARECREAPGRVESIWSRSSDPQKVTAAKHASLTVPSEQGSGLAYYLAKNPDVANRIAKMDSAQAALAIVRLEQRLAGQIRTPVGRLAGIPSSVNSDGQ